MKVRLSSAVRSDLDLSLLKFPDLPGELQRKKLRGRGGVGQKKEVDLVKEIQENVFAFNLA